MRTDVLAFVAGGALAALAKYAPDDECNPHGIPRPSVLDRAMPERS